MWICVSKRVNDDILCLNSVFCLVFIIFFLRFLFQEIAVNTKILFNLKKNWNFFLLGILKKLYSNLNSVQYTFKILSPSPRMTFFFVFLLLYNRMYDNDFFLGFFVVRKGGTKWKFNKRHFYQFWDCWRYRITLMSFIFFKNFDNLNN